MNLLKIYSIQEIKMHQTLNIPEDIPEEALSWFVCWFQVCLSL